jgi:hypothetical protein
MMSALATNPAAFAAPAGSGEVSLFRLHLLRATYLLLVVGLGATVWPQIISHPLSMHSATPCLLGGVSLLALIGLRHPLKMLPLLFFELVWKSLWLLTVALPLWRAHQIDADVADSIQACAMGIIFPFVIPWSYVWTNYVAARGARWR